MQDFVEKNWKTLLFGTLGVALVGYGIYKRSLLEEVIQNEDE